MICIHLLVRLNKIKKKKRKECMAEISKNDIHNFHRLQSYNNNKKIELLISVLNQNFNPFLSNFSDTQVKFQLCSSVSLKYYYFFNL